MAVFLHFLIQNKDPRYLVSYRKLSCCNRLYCITVEHLYNRHHWDQQTCPYHGGVFIIIKYQNGESLVYRLVRCPFFRGSTVHCKLSLLIMYMYMYYIHVVDVCGFININCYY